MASFQRSFQKAKSTPDYHIEEAKIKIWLNIPMRVKLIVRRTYKNNNSGNQANDVRQYLNIQRNDTNHPFLGNKINLFPLMKK